MKRRNFIKGILGLAAVPMVAKAAPKLPYEELPPMTDEESGFRPIWNKNGLEKWYAEHWNIDSLHEELKPGLEEWAKQSFGKGGF